VSQITDRGYTGHEHLDQFGLINMNGRIYDPVLGRFLGVDPVIQAPDYSQSFNGYSYSFNNPLKYIDPTGFVADGLTIYDLVNNLWNSGGGYWSSRNPDYFLPYYHDYDPYESSLLEYSVVHFLNGSQSSGPGGGGGEGRVYYSKSKDEYGYWSKTTVESSGIRYVKPGRYIDGYIGYGIWNISVSSKWIGINFPVPSGQGGEQKDPLFKFIGFNHGIPEFESRLMPSGTAVTPGPFIIYSQGNSSEPYFNTHEPGHIVQFYLLGPSNYIRYIAISSLISVTLFPYQHKYMPWETSANQLWFWLTGERYEENP
jgi:RHS repeat-associated protein